MDYKTSKVSVIEMASPTLLFLWATWFFLFDASDSSPSYEYAKFLTNFDWAIVFFAAATFKAASIVTNRLIWRRVAIVISLCLWILMLFIFAFSNFQSHAVPTCIYFVFINILAAEKLFASPK